VFDKKDIAWEEANITKLGLVTMTDINDDDPASNYLGKLRNRDESSCGKASAALHVTCGTRKPLDEIAARFSELRSLLPVKKWSGPHSSSCEFFAFEHLRTMANDLPTTQRWAI
jgi:hypothetical protein